MKLYEAMLEGCKESTPLRNATIRFLPNGTVQACAMGAAALATGLDLTKEDRERFGALFLQVLEHLDRTIPGITRTLNSVVDRCPVEGCEPARLYTVRGLVIHLNDLHQWPREDIALQFLKPLEER